MYCNDLAPAFQNQGGSSARLMGHQQFGFNDLYAAHNIRPLLPHYSIFFTLKEEITVEKTTSGRMKSNKIDWSNFNKCRENGRDQDYGAEKNPEG